MDQRRVKRTNRKPRFLWQGVLILAPMLVLAKVGALAIWQDKRMAQHEAELRARDLAEQTVEKLAADWVAHRPTNADSILLDSDGNLLNPKPIQHETNTVIVRMSDAQSDLLQRARWAEFSITNRQEALVLFQEFLDSTPLPSFAQQARYSMALLHLSGGDATNAARVFQALLDDPSPAFGDAGGDLKTLSLLKLALMSGSGFDAVCSNAVANPTPLTPQILRFLFDAAFPAAKEAAELWWNAWQEDELKRYVWAEVQSSFESNVLFRSGPQVSTAKPPSIFVGRMQGDVTNRAPIRRRISGVNNVNIVTTVAGSLAAAPLQPPARLWITVPNEDEFARPIGAGARIKPMALSSGRLDSTRFVEGRPFGSNHWIEFWTASALAEWAGARTETLRAPEYFGVSVSIGNYDVVRPDDLPAIQYNAGGKGSGQSWTRTHRTTAPAVLASASRTGAGDLVFVARVHLIGPGLLFEQQNARSTWFGLVVGVAALTSIIGFISAYRAFHKQQRLAEMKSNFVSSVSHELRAPIASVRLMAEGLERGKISEPAKQREYFRFITQECRRLSSMIENVLDFARIEQGRKQYEFEPTDVAALVEKTVQLMEPYAAERGVKLRNAERGMRNAELADDTDSAHSEFRTPHSALLDGQAIQQALVNLIDNAIKHSPSGSEVAIGLTLSSQLSTLNLSVSDHGPGIPAAEHEKIFERFYRLGSELRRETPGVGIGLSIVKHVAEAHGGRVRVESEAGKGSRFTIELPLSVPPASCRVPGLDETKTRQDAGGTLGGAA